MPGGFHPPPSVIAAWPKPNYTDPEAKGSELLVVSIVFTVLSSVAVAARLWVRLRHKNQAGADDVIVGLCMIPTLGIAGLLVWSVTRFRWYRHIWDVPFHELSGRQLHSWIVQILFVLSTALSKLSALLLYKCVIAGTTRPALIYVVNGAIAAQAIYGIAFISLAVFQCWPINAYWLQYSYPQPYAQDFKCMFEGSVIMANAYVSVATDFLAASLPLLLLRQLRLPTREKVALGAMFGVGFLVCIMGIVRSILAHRLFYNSYDVTWLSHDVWAWTYVESNLLVICTAIPPLKVYFERFLAGGAGLRNAFRGRRTNSYAGLEDRGRSARRTLAGVAMEDVEGRK